MPLKSNSFFSPKIPNTLKDDIQRVRERISCNGFWNDKYQVLTYNQIWRILGIKALHVKDEKFPWNYDSNTFGSLL